MISDHVILHELTHADKDTIVAPLHHILPDGSVVVGINGLSFRIVSPTGKKGKFTLVEEAVADYLVWKLEPTKLDPKEDPRYYALLSLMKILDNNHIIDAENMKRAVRQNDHIYILRLFGLQDDPERGSRLFSIFAEVYMLWLDAQGNLESDLSLVSKKVQDYCHESFRLAK